MTYAKKTLSEIKLIHGNYGNFIKGQKIDKKKEKKYKTPPYQDLAASNEIDGEPLDEKCWPGYEKKGMKTMFGKRYPNCVKKKKTRKEDFSDWRSEINIDERKMTEKEKRKDDRLKKKYEKSDDMMKSFKDQYGEKEGEKIFYAKIRKEAMKEGVGSVVKGGLKLLTKSKPFLKTATGNLTKAKPKPGLLGKAATKVGGALTPGYIGYEIGKEMGKSDKEAIEKDLENVKQDAAYNQGYYDSVLDSYRKQIEDMKKKPVKEDNIQEILDKKDIPHVKKLVGKLRKGSKTHAKQADDLEKAMNEDITDEALTIQDWNVDDIKFTEIETVDIIKAKPLKENVNLEEGVKRKIIKKLVSKAIKKLGKGGKSSKYTVDKALSKKVQLQSIKNQAKYPSELGRQINKGTTPVKVDVSKPINFDKYFGGSPSPVKKKFGTQKPTGTFIDDLPPPEVKPLSKSQRKLMKKLDKQQMKDIENDPMSKIIKKQIEKETGTKTRKFSQKGGVTKGNENEILSNVKPKPKKPLKDHFDWRNELDEDWQKVNRKDKTDGLSKAAVKAYRRENPGSKLQTAVTKDPKKLKKGSKSAKRRLSFCRRMKGMKKKLTSAKTRRDPDSRINKALRRWNC